MSASFETPILFLVFNRPRETARVFATLRSLRPRRLFVASDGARAHRRNEVELVNQTRAIATAVDWPCEVSTLFRKENLGCGRAVSSAITWFFEHVEEGIILEDDCLPHPDFFPFCQILLARYRHEPRVASIAGTHFLPPALDMSARCYASKYFQMWGWASWRRAWQQYDFSLHALSDAAWETVIKSRHPTELEASYWRQILSASKYGGVDTWDFQFFFSAWRHEAVHLMPGRNLVSNLGFGPDATHTNFVSPMANLPTFPLTLDDTPIALTPDPAIDSLIFFLRFLESLTQVGWLEKAILPNSAMGRSVQAQADAITLLQSQLEEKHRQLRLAVSRHANI